MKLKLLLFAVLLSCFFACKKSTDADITFPLKIYLSGQVQNGALHVYTASGEITDAGVKSRFLGQEAAYFNVAYTPGDTSSITFLSRDTAVFSGSTVKYGVVNNNGMLLFSSAGYPVTLTNITDVNFKILQYPGPTKQVYSYTNGIGYVTKEVRVAKGNYNNLNLSVLTYKWVNDVKSVYGETRNMYATTIFNQFNSNVLATLGANDTLAVQQATIGLQAR